MTRPVWAVGAVFGIMLGAIAFGAWSGFPYYDDAYMVLFLREASLEALRAQHSSRPLYGLLLSWVAGAFGLRPGPYAAMTTAFWALLAWQTFRLSRRLFPGEPEIAPLSAVLTLTPILVTTQYTTATTLLPCNLPVLLCVAALLLCLRDGDERQRARLFGALFLVGLAVVLSEYGIATGAAAIALLLIQRRPRAAGVVLVGLLLGYVVFRVTGDVSVRVKQLPSVQIERFLQRPQAALFRFLEGLWHCLVGAWGTAAGALRFDVWARSTLLGALLGTFAALTMSRVSRPERTWSAGPAARRASLGLLLAIAAGILPVVLANRSTVSSDPFDTRYMLPVLPFVGVAIALALHRVPVSRFRGFACGSLAFLAVYWVVVGAFDVRREQARMEELGELLRPLVRDPGITVVVVPDEWRRDAHELTPKVDWRWDNADGKRLWVMPAGRAEEEFGPRGTCRNAAWIETAPELQSTGRKGTVSHLVWLAPLRASVGVLEPYCVGPVL